MNKGSSSDDSSHFSHHESDNVDTEIPALAQKETEAVKTLKRTMIALLAIACGAIATSLFLVTSSFEKKAFVQAFDNSAEGIATSFIGDTKAKFVATYQTSFTATTRAHLGAEAPNISVPFFDARILPTLQGARIRMISWSPMLANLQERLLWEAYAAEQVDSPLIASKGPDPVCYVCGEGMRVAHSEQEVSYPGVGIFNCGTQEEDALAGAINPTYCSLMKEDILRDCGCEPIMNGDIADQDETPMVVEERTIADEIFKMNESHETVIQNGEGPYFPMWQLAPFVGNEKNMLYDQMSDPVRKSALEAMIDSRLPVMSATYTGFDYVVDHSDGPGAVVYYPVFSSPTADRVVGAIGAEFSWRNYFSFQFPEQSEGIIVVVENTCGQNLTFRIEDLQMIFQGESDLHDSTYDDLMRETSFETFSEYQNGVSYSAVVGTDFDKVVGCAYKVRVYPSKEIEESYYTNLPTAMTVVSVLIFMFVSSVFLTYDCYVGKRQNVVMDSATRANTIVSSLFPAGVRGRLFANASNDHARASSYDAKEPEDTHNVERTVQEHVKPKALDRLQSFLDRTANNNAAEEVEALALPIADKFENSTVLFADLVGFTKWCSTRDPVAVFNLLESLFGEFDKIAKFWKVYKVETIGDCYMAVTGVPEYQKLHAVAMVKFAAACRKEMASRTVKMAKSLGPDTALLRMRIGVHSGSVTGGVLRGERSRFQLFGDTVNTASRMESTGSPDQIQASEATANLLIEAGKSHWITPREDRVEAKGKGSMQTYWVNPIRRPFVSGKTEPTSNSVSTYDSDML